MKGVFLSAPAEDFNCYHGRAIFNPTHWLGKETRLYRADSAMDSCFLAGSIVRPTAPRIDSPPCDSWRSSDRDYSLRSASAPPGQRWAQAQEEPDAARRGRALRSPARLRRPPVAPRARSAARLEAPPPGFPKRKLFPPLSARPALFCGRIRPPECP